MSGDGEPVRWQANKLGLSSLLLRRFHPGHVVLRPAATTARAATAHNAARAAAHHARHHIPAARARAAPLPLLRGLLAERIVSGGRLTRAAHHAALRAQ
jgi:hypothetical protein